MSAHALVRTDAQAAEVSVRIGKGVAIEARVTAAGLLSVGALVSAILLSTAVIVRSKRPG